MRKIPYVIGIGLDEAREKAKIYSNTIADRKKKVPGNRYLERAWTYITTFATSGNWPTGSFLEEDVVE